MNNGAMFFRVLCPNTRIRIHIGNSNIQFYNKGTIYSQNNTCLQKKKLVHYVRKLACEFQIFWTCDSEEVDI